MSEFTEILRTSLLPALLDGVMGQTVTYRQDLAGTFEVQALITRGAEVEASKSGVLATAMVRASDFATAPRREPKSGDKMTFDGVVYQVVDVTNGGIGDRLLYLQWKANA